MLYQLIKFLITKSLKTLIHISVHWTKINFFYLNPTLTFENLSPFHKLLITILFKGSIIFFNFDIINNIMFDYELFFKIIEKPNQEVQDLFNELNEQNSLSKDSFFINKFFYKLLWSFLLFILIDILFENKQQ